MTITERMAKALYDHWCDEAELHGETYVEWDVLMDKDTWLSRALRVRTALFEAGYVIREEEAKP